MWVLKKKIEFVEIVYGSGVGSEFGLNESLLNDYRADFAFFSA